MVLIRIRLSFMLSLFLYITSPRIGYITFLLDLLLHGLNCKKKILKKFFPTSTIGAIRKQISGIRQT